MPIINNNNEQIEFLLKLLHIALSSFIIEEKEHTVAIPELYINEKEYLSIPVFQNYNLEIGEFYEKKNQWDLAVEHFERAFEINPENPLVNIKLALSHLHLSNIDKSREYFEKFQKLYPENKIIRAVTGYLMFLQGQEREGIGIIRDIIKEDDENLLYYYFLAEIYLKWQHNDLAIEEIKKVLLINPSSPDAHFILGRIYREQRDFDLAIKHMKISIEIEPNMILAYNAIGNIHLMLGDMELASGNYSKVIELDPSNGEAYNSLGVIYASREELDSSITYFKKALNISPNNKEYHSNISLAYLEKGYVEKAIEHYSVVIGVKVDDIEFYPLFAEFIKKHEKIKNTINSCINNLDGNPSNLYSINTIAELYKITKNYEMSYEYYKKAITVDKDGEWKYAIYIGDMMDEYCRKEQSLAYYQRAMELIDNSAVYEKLARAYEPYRLDLSIKYYREILKFNIHDEGFYYYNIATAYFLQHSIENAMVHYKIAMTIDPRRETLCCYFIGKCALFQGDLNLAKNFMEKVMVQEPTMASPSYILGVIYEKMGDETKALWHYEKAIEKNPLYSKAKYRSGLIHYKRVNKAMALEYFLSCFESPLIEKETFFKELEDIIIEIGKESPGYLTNALKGENFYLRFFVAKCLAKMGNLNGAVSLADYILSADNPEEIRDIIKEFNNKEVTKKLIEVIKNDNLTEKETRGLSEIIKILGERGEKKAIVPLLFLYQKITLLKPDIVEALIKIKFKDIILYIEEDLKSYDSGIQNSAILSLGRLKNKDYMEKLKCYLKHNDTDIKASAICAIGDMPSKETINILMEVLKDKDKNMKLLALKAIKKIYSNKKIIIGDNIQKKMLNSLLSLLEEKEGHVNLKIIEIMEFMPSDDTVGILIKSLKDNDYRIRACSAKILGITGRTEVIKELIPLTEDIYPIVREKAIEALGELKAFEVTDKLLYILKHDFYWLRRCAAIALGKIAEPAATDEFISLLSDEQIREDIIWAIGKTGEGSEKIKNILLKLWDECEELEKITLASTLVRLGHKEKKEFIQRALLSKRENLRKKAIETMKELKD